MSVTNRHQSSIINHIGSSVPLRKFSLFCLINICFIQHDTILTLCASWRTILHSFRRYHHNNNLCYTLPFTQHTTHSACQSKVILFCLCICLFLYYFIFIPFIFLFIYTFISTRSTTTPHGSVPTSSVFSVIWKYNDFIDNYLILIVKLRKL